MVQSFSITLLIVLLSALNALAGFGSSYSSTYSSDSVVAPIQIKDKGLYNLVLSIQFLNEPYDKKMYKSDEYENFIRRLKVEWSGVALLQILKAKETSVNDLAGLKGNIEAEIAKLVDQLKNTYAFEKNVEVVFSLSNFFLLEPKYN
jgi:LPS O-antigen subunit length determinant protein (WzzB/FepE family)